MGEQERLRLTLCYARLDQLIHANSRFLRGLGQLPVPTLPGLRMLKHLPVSSAAREVVQPVKYCSPWVVGLARPPPPRHTPCPANSCAHIPSLAPNLKHHKHHGAALRPPADHGRAGGRAAFCCRNRRRRAGACQPPCLEATTTAQASSSGRHLIPACAHCALELPQAFLRMRLARQRALQLAPAAARPSRPAMRRASRAAPSWAL